jgi:2,4-dienoyl-CoA reductase-like NADH-dependent reductase (Old Yellow Enzyme family)
VAPDVFAPATLGPVRLRNRTVKAATFEGRTPAGKVTDGLIDYHLAVAEGGVGLTTVAYLAIAPEGRTHREQIVVGPDTEKGPATPARWPTAAPTVCPRSAPAGCPARCRCR